MIVVIQCAASKRPDAGHLRLAGGKPVIFVADPKTAPADPAYQYARPDDPSDTGSSWRQMLLKYNEMSGENPLDLSPAWQLYENRAYARLVGRFGFKNVYILSAGWGLIRADFLTPYYDITFSQAADGYKRRRKAERYQDFRMPPDQTDEDIVFFGSKDYIPLFYSLTSESRGKKTVFYNSAHVPQKNGYTLMRFETSTRTNWHYECANAYMDGSLGVA
jgi:hypothetical protein